MLSEKYVNPWLKQETTEFDLLNNKYWVPGKYGVSVAPLMEDKYINPWLKQETWIVTTPEVTPIQESQFANFFSSHSVVSCTVTVTCSQCNGTKERSIDELFTRINAPEEWLKEKE